MGLEQTNAIPPIEISKEEKWNLRKLEIEKQVSSIKGEDGAKKFMIYYSRKYDPFQKELLDWRLCITLLDDYYHCKRVGTKWYACVGPGGTGKSTLMQNIFYFLDDKFSLKETNMNIKDFLNKLDDDSMLEGMRALFMDEPDDDIHPQTELGKKFRKILGKARQAKFFFGTCATDLTDIPPYIFRKIDVMIFTPKLGHFMLVKNRPRIKQYPIQTVRRDYQKHGYDVFYRVASEFSVLNGWTGNNIPFTQEELDVYKKDKWADFRTDIQDVKDLLENKKGDRQKKTLKDDIVVPLANPEPPKVPFAYYESKNKKTIQRMLINMKKSGLSVGKICQATTLSNSYVKMMLNEAKSS